ncbi:MAG: peptidylprolyl isomerase [Lawsonibacter sp.]|nr:peptidylprolyl isomerase [Lawsonibacter sp.]
MSASKEKKTRQDVTTQGPIGREQKRQQEEKEARRSTIRYIAVGVVCVVLALFLMIWNTGLIQRNATAATINGVKYSTTDVQYYFNSTRQRILSYYSQNVGMMPFDYNTSTKTQVYDSSTGETWYDYLMDQTMDTMSRYAAIYDKLQSADYTMSDEAKEYLDNSLANLETTWQGSNYTSRDAYLRASYGPYITYNHFVELYTKGILISDYMNFITKGFTFDSSDYEGYYQDNADTLDSYTLSQLVLNAEVVTTDADGKTIEMTDDEKAAALDKAKTEKKAVAEEIQAKLEAGADPSDLAKEYADQLSGAATLSKAVVGSTISSAPYAQWAMDGTRQAGDVTVSEYDGGATSYYYYVVVFEGRARDNSPTDTVRHILVVADTDKGADAPTDEQYATAKTKAEDLLNQWKSGPATEDSFAQLARDNSADTGSAADGGLITNVYSGSGYVTTFTDWATDDTRNPGDTGIVQNTASTVKGWHIMYYVGATGDPVWQITADSAMRSQAYSTWEDSIRQGYDGTTSGLGVKFIRA